jgi:NADH dehydrogenase [ubiquinone] 1 alpha subcomplex assembly factor 5
MVKRDFKNVAVLGSGSGDVLMALQEEAELGNPLETVIQCDLAETAFTKQRPELKLDGKVKVHNLVCDEEFLPLAPNSCDLIVSNLSMHWVNRLPSVSASILRALKPDGCFMVSMLGGETLCELRSAFALADLERLGGVLPQVSPFAGQRDLGDVLHANGFNLITLDNEVITSRYPDMFTLMEHLQGMGEQNSVTSTGSSKVANQDSFLAAASIYESLYREQGDLELLEASFHVLYGIGWKPHESQPKPLERGSAALLMNDALSGDQQDTAPPKKDTPK